MKLNGNLLLGHGAVRGTHEAVRAIDPSSGESIDPDFFGAGLNHLEQACELAWRAFEPYRALPLKQRAVFLDTIAEQMDLISEVLVERCATETGLPRARVENERLRTINQLRMFAGVVRQGDFLGVRHDPALPARQPMGRVDLRSNNVPLGPVAVFGASNFPLAFSVAGGDTASALAAGCPVIVKAHSAHPGTSELAGRAVQAASKACGIPSGTFSLLFDNGRTIAQELVKDRRIKGVAFTGSRTGGTALMALAATRGEPIPVYAEMSSINPVILFPAALRSRCDPIAQAFIAAMVLGAGQFCTNPGLVFAVESPDLGRFLESAAAALQSQRAATMLTPDIHRAFCLSTTHLSLHPKVECVASGAAPIGPCDGRAQLFTTTFAEFVADASLREEVFGAASLIVRCPSLDAIRASLELLEGQLTTALHFTREDEGEVRPFIRLLERKVGRIVANGFGTGVEVGHAMVHGGSFPATADGRSTSIGSGAIERFLRPVCYQDLPDELLPLPVQTGNPLGLTRRIDGVLHVPRH